MRRSIVTFLSLQTAFILSRCSDANPSARDNGISASNASACTPHSWQSDIGALFKNRCGSCHPGSQSSDYSSYASLKGNIGQAIVRIDKGDMPPGGLSTSEKNSIHAWVASGLPETTTCSSSQNGTAPTTPKPSNPVGPNVPLTSVLSWDGGIGKIFIAQCASCHNGTNQPTNYGTYDGVKTNIRTEILRMQSGSMPPSGALANSDMTLINNWIAAGMPKTDADIPAGSLPSQPPALTSTYANGVKIIMDANCTSCHGGKTAPNLTTLSNVKNNFSKSLSTMKSGEMPRGAAKLPSDQIKIFENWGSPTNPYGQWAP